MRRSLRSQATRVRVEATLGWISSPEGGSLPQPIRGCDVSDPDEDIRIQKINEGRGGPDGSTEVCRVGMVNGVKVHHQQFHLGREEESHRWIIFLEREAAGVRD